MKHAFDRSSVLKTLRNGVEKGYWTVEDLDIPTSGWIASSTTNEVMQSGAKSALKLAHNAGKGEGSKGRRAVEKIKACVYRKYPELKKDK